MNIYLHELRSLRKSTFLWVCALAAMSFIYFSVYPSIVADAENFKALFNAYPPSVLAMLNVTLDNLTSLLGFYTMIFTFLALFGAIQAMNLGLSILSKEVRERTADFLLVKPVSRSRIVSMKLLASVTMLLITNALFYLIVFAFAQLYKTAEYDVAVFFMINFTLLFIQLIFFALGAVISVFVPKIKNVLPISLGIVFLFFFAGAFLVEGADDPVRYLTPFEYFDVAYIVQNAAYETSYLLAGAAVVIVSITVTYLNYIRKDIYAVS